MTKRSDPANMWAWVYKDKRRLSEKGGRHRAIVENYDDFWRNINDDYVAAEFAITRALEAARETGEIKWELHLRHWRIQLWLRQRLVRRALPEAMDLLSLATDRRVSDVPQRICAFHDIVECYLDVDPVGYHEEIVANAQDVLAQLPQRHPCATCARFNLARTSAAVGKAQETEHWINQTRATLMQPIYNELIQLIQGFGAASSLTANWDEAERYYQQAREIAQERDNRAEFIAATLSLVRVHLAKDEVEKALDMLQIVRHNMKFRSREDNLATLAEMEGRVAARTQHPQLAVDHLTRAARLYLDPGCYRDAAQAALLAAEVAREAAIELPAETLELAAQAVGQLPPTSQDLYQRLATFEREPIAPSSDEQQSEFSDAQELAQKELRMLENLLQEHIAHHHYADISMMLYRLAAWHSERNQIRAALDYFVAEAALERLLKLSYDERREVIEALRNELPTGIVEAAFAAAQSGPPSWMQPLLAEVPLSYWGWVIRGIEAEVTEQPFVEPEPQIKTQ